MASQASAVDDQPGYICQQSGAGFLFLSVQRVDSPRYLCCAHLDNDGSTYTIVVTDGLDNLWEKIYDMHKLETHREKHGDFSWKDYFKHMCAAFIPGEVFVDLRKNGVELTIGKAKPFIFDLDVVTPSRKNNEIQNLLFMFAKHQSSSVVTHLRQELQETKKQLNFLRNRGAEQVNSYQEGRKRRTEKKRKKIENKLNPSQRKRKPATGVVFDDDEDNSSSSSDG